MADNPLEPMVDAAVEGMRRRLDIVDRAVPEKTVPVGQRQLTAEELYMRDAFVPGYRGQALQGTSWADGTKYFRLIAKGRETFRKKHGDI
ncbi:MAG: hypothetical protein E3J81_09010 [Dehalococcoidia bacterium]|nr:MAG: hypothetical protein E3J81_09010 [Dehalococcoidia bacterium]